MVLREDSKIRDVGAFLLLLFATAVTLFFLWQILMYLYGTDYPAPWVE